MVEFYCKPMQWILMIFLSSRPPLKFKYSIGGNEAWHSGLWGELQNGNVSRLEAGDSKDGATHQNNLKLGWNLQQRWRVGEGYEAQQRGEGTTRLVWFARRWPKTTRCLPFCFECQCFCSLVLLLFSGDADREWKQNSLWLAFEAKGSHKTANMHETSQFIACVVRRYRTSAEKSAGDWIQTWNLNDWIERFRLGYMTIWHWQVTS